jgi:hypothetical protein
MKNTGRLKSFAEFINENYQLNEKRLTGSIVPLQILMRHTVGLTGKGEPFTKAAMAIIYKKYVNMVLIKADGEYNEDTPGNRGEKIDYDLPILNFTSVDHRFLIHNNSIVYNPVKEMKYSADKKLFHKTFANTDFVPKAVFDLKDIKELKEPIIAKPTDGHSAQGIELFDTYSDAKKSKMKFDLWSEAKEIDREFRAFFMDGNLLLIAERITNSSNDQSVGKKDVEDKIDLIYIDQQIETFPYLKEIKRIAKEISKGVKLDFFNIDLILDKDGKLWVPEINGAPGIGPSMFWPIYQAWMSLTNNSISSESSKELKDIMVQHRKDMADRYTDEYKGSLIPINHE